MTNLRPSAFLLGMLLAVMTLVLIACWLGRSFDIEPPWVERWHVRRQVNSRGETIRLFFDLRVYDARSGELKWSAPRPPCSTLPVLVGDHYLAGCTLNKIEVVDIDDAKDTPFSSEVGRQHKQVQWRPLELKVPDLTWTHFDLSEVIPIPGSSCFLVHNPGAKPAAPSSVYAVEIESRSLRLLAQWTCAHKGLFVLPSGQINSVKADSSAVEVRWGKDFAIERTLPFPTGVQSRQIATRNSLMSYPDPKTQVSRVCRLDDFSPIPELNIPLLGSNIQEVGNDHRYHILSDQHLRASRRLVVYDSVDRKIAYDSGSALGFKHADIQQGQLRLSTLVLGLTTQIIDLKSGQVVRTERPYLWIITAMPLVLLAAMGWLTFWIARIPCPSRLLPLNVLFVASLFLIPLFWRTGRAGFNVFGPYPTVQYTHSTVLALVFCLAIYAAFGRGRLLLRAIPFLASMSILLIVVETFELVDFKQAGNGPAQIAFRIWVTFAVFSLGTLYAMRYVGWRLRRRGQARGEVANAKRSKVYLADFFAVTAFVALSIKVFGPQFDLLLHPTMKWFVVGRSALLTGMALLGMLALVRSPRAYRVLVLVAVGISLVAIADVVVHVSLEVYRNELWYRVASDVRYPVFLMLATFAFCSMLREGLNSVDLRTNGNEAYPT